jgi:hypothetical protein
LVSRPRDALSASSNLFDRPTAENTFLSPTTDPFPAAYSQLYNRKFKLVRSPQSIASLHLAPLLPRVFHKIV